jgi:Zn-dependent protease
MFFPAIMFVPAAFFALVIPKYVQARLAARAGDPSVTATGRLSWNPLVHLDLLGAALLVFFQFGWAKPLRVDANKLERGRTSAVLIAVAGPVVNLILAVIFGLGVWALVSASGVSPSGDSFVYEFAVAASRDFALKYGFMLLFACAFANMVMALLNLIPVPPFDFGGILRMFLPESARISLDRATRYLGYVFVVFVFFERLTGAKALYYVLYTPVSYLLASLTGTTGFDLYELFYVLTRI